MLGLRQFFLGPLSADDVGDHIWDVAESLDDVAIARVDDDHPPRFDFQVIERPTNVTPLWSINDLGTCCK